MDEIVTLINEVAIDIGTKKLKQQVKYEYKPKFCLQCQQISHVCPKPRRVMQWVPKKVPWIPPPNHVPTVLTRDSPI